jgi:thiamine-monophosphate kinase
MPPARRDPFAGLVIDVTVLGAVAPERVLTRAGARPGDRVLVVGALGGAASGRHLLAGDAPDEAVDAETREALVGRWRRPRARVDAARAIAKTGLATAMIDVSDGFAADLGHVCDASGVGVRVEAARLPLAPGVGAVAAAMAGRLPEGGVAGDARAGVWPYGPPHDPALALALGGGEDYALLLTASPADVPALTAALPPGALADVGAVVDEASGRTLVDADGRTRPLPESGWRHVG